MTTTLISNSRSIVLSLSLFLCVCLSVFLALTFSLFPLDRDKKQVGAYECSFPSMQQQLGSSRRKSTRMHGTTHRGMPRTLTYMHSCFCAHTHTHTHTARESVPSPTKRNGTEHPSSFRYTLASVSLTIYLSLSLLLESRYSLPPLVALTRGIYNTMLANEEPNGARVSNQGVVFRNTALFFISTYK